MSGRDRPKASEIFNRSGKPYACGKHFQLAFPQITDYQIEIERTSASGKPHKSFYSPNNPIDEFVDCDNLSCYNGGVSIGSIVKEMMKNKLIDYQEDVMCQGNEAGPKGKKITQKCINMINVKIHLDIKE